MARKKDEGYDWLDDPFDEKKAAQESRGMSGTAKGALGCACLLAVVALVALLGWLVSGMLSILAS